MTTYIVTICLVASIAFLLGAMFASRGDQPIKRTIEQMNEVEKVRHELRKSDAARSLAAYYLLQIIDGLEGQQSGAAQKAVRLAKMGMGE